MIISEKQIIQLIKLTEAYRDTLNSLINEHPNSPKFTKKLVLLINNLLQEIRLQQSEELKEIR